MTEENHRQRQWIKPGIRTLQAGAAESGNATEEDAYFNAS